MTACCYACYGKPKETYACGFKRERTPCDKGTEQNILYTYPLSFMERMVYSFDAGQGYIKYENKHGKWFFCSILCLHKVMNIYAVTKNMNDFDKEGILEQFKIESVDYNKTNGPRDQISLENDLDKEILENDSLDEFEEEFAALQLENEQQEEMIQAMKTADYDQLVSLQLENAQQKEIIQKWKESFEKKQKEFDKLMETTKAKDREIFCLIARNMELEKK